MLPLPAETSREAPKCCSIKGGGPETRSGTVQSLKCCPCQQKRAARLPSAAPGSMKRKGPETRSGTVQSLKCCPCQQKRAARLPSAAPGGGGPRNALGCRPEPEVLPLPAETSREAPKCCAWQRLAASRGGALKRARAPSRACQQKRAARLPSAAPGSIKTVQSLKCCPCQQKRAARLPSPAPGSIKPGAPKRARVPSRA